MTEPPNVFVGGPIQYALNGTDFDDSLKLLFTKVHASLEGAGYGVLSAHRAEKFGEITAAFTSDEIAVRDHTWMQLCAAFVAVIPADQSGVPYRTDGTHIELGWASGQRKPIVLVATLPLSRGYSQVVHGLRKITLVDILDARMVSETPWLVVDSVRRALAGFAANRAGALEARGHTGPAPAAEGVVESTS
jgi:nucleoside 2-deoxyribosyltransferase